MCSRKPCISCSKAEDCGWCTTSNAVSAGYCLSLSEADTCSASVVTEKGQCPSVGGDVILKNITGMLGAMIGVAIILNVYNRVSNRRRRRKLQHSIFELPVYVYTASTHKRVKAATLARLQAQGQERGTPSETQNGDATGSPVAPASRSSPGSSSSSEDGDEASVVTCTVCLAAYEENEVIKVLPCGHEFHSGCLDSWLEQKATCPLCMAPAFAKLRNQGRTSHSQATIQGLRQQADAAPPLITPPDQQAQSSQGGGAMSGDGVDGGLLLANGEAGVDHSLPLNEVRRSGEPTLETAQREDGGEEEEEGATAVSAIAMAMAVEEGAAAVQKDGAISEEMVRTAAVDTDIRVGSGEGASGAAGGGAGGGWDEGPVAATHPPGAPSRSYHGGDTTADTATYRVTPRRADREVSLTKLEKGQARPAQMAVVVAGLAEDAVDFDRVIADGGIAV